MIELRTTHWLLGIALAALVYAVAALLYFSSTPPSAAARDRGIGGIEVGLGPVGGASGADTTTEAMEEVEPEQLPEPEPTIEPEVVKETPTEPEQSLEITEEPAEELITEVLSEPPLPQPAQAETVAGFSGQSGSQDAPDHGEGDDTAGGGNVGITPNYALTLQTWLERHKEYPRNASRRRQEGVALLYLKMDRRGHVLDYRIEESSGHRWLDQEVMDMVDRANPLPALPDSMSQSTLEVVVPVEFLLSRRR
ncbi:MAG: energy transducer TonB [Pseudomonadota bacterium]